MTSHACRRIDADRAENHPGGPLRVLFVEDCEDDAALLLIALTEEFGDLLHARVDCAQELRCALARQQWDLIICDNNMPALDAAGALAIAQQQGSAAPFLIVSGSMCEAAAVAAMKAGAADMISKQALSRLAPVARRALKGARDVAQLRLAQAQVRQLSCFDEDTGLPRRAFLATTMAAWLASPAWTAPLAMAVVDVTRFSQIAHSLGAVAAAEALRAVGARLQRSVAGSGCVASLGNDRFALLLAGPAAAGPSAVAARINEEAALALAVGGQDLFVALRIGVSLFPRDGADFEQLLANAEGALGQVAAGAMPNYRMFEPGIQAARDRHWSMVQALHRAVREKEFSLHYQPQYDLGTGRIVGVEALLRWRQPDATWVSPAEFIPLLEESGLIVPLGEWVLRTACLQNLAWQSGAAPVRVAVNLSVIQFQDPGLVPMVRRVLAETGMDCAFLDLEITENIAMHNEGSVIEKLAGLRALGVRLAIDDFGTGYSSLSYLRRFPVQTIKIDQSFVRDITEAVPDSPIVRAIMALAHNLGIHVIAEGVEEERHERFLLSCGCTEMQGFRFSRPVPPQDLMPLLHAANGAAPCGNGTRGGGQA